MGAERQTNRVRPRQEPLRRASGRHPPAPDLHRARNQRQVPNPRAQLATAPVTGARTVTDPRPQAGGLPDRPSSIPADDSDIFLVNTDGSNVRRIVNGSGRDMYPRFSQDGSQVIYLAEGNGPGGLVGEADDSGWYSIALDGSDVRRLTFGLPPMPEYSPDGRYLAMVTRWDEVYTMRADGTDIRRWPGTSYYNSQVAWAPSGPTLFYAALDREIRAQVIYRADRVLSRRGPGVGDEGHVRGLDRRHRRARTSRRPRAHYGPARSRAAAAGPDWGDRDCLRHVQKAVSGTFSRGRQAALLRG